MLQVSVKLRREAEAVERWNLTHPDETPRVSYVEELLSKNTVPTVAVSDYIKLVSDQIRPYVPDPITVWEQTGLAEATHVKD